jgi:hypothetical protein
MPVNGANQSDFKQLEKPIEKEQNLSSPIPEVEKKASLVRLDKIIKDLEGISFSPEVQNNAMAYLFYSLVNSANTILKALVFRDRVKDASFTDLMKGLETLLDQIVKINNLTGSSPDSKRGQYDKKTLRMSEKIKELEVIRQGQDFKKE